MRRTAPVALDTQSPATFQTEPGGHEEAKVVSVTDGDTIRVQITGRVEGPGAGAANVGEEYPVRLVGIDTPETVKPGTHATGILDAPGDACIMHA